MTRVNVLLFASYAEALGTHAMEVEVGEKGRVRDVLDAVLARSALRGAATLPKDPLVAVNEEYATLETPVAANDEVAIIPPVAGG